MKSSKTLLFILSVIIILGTVWWFFPSDGILIGKFTLRFPSLEEALSPDSLQEVDIDALLAKQKRDTLSSSMQDSLLFYRVFLSQNPARFDLPEGDYRFFDTLFQEFETARANDTIVRVMHYGDSQIEMDRISGILRDDLQERFGGSGAGMLRAVQPHSMVSILQKSTEGLQRYVVFWDSTTLAPHDRYGVMAQFAQTSGQNSVTFRESRHRAARERAKIFSKVTLLYRAQRPGFSATLKCDTLPAQTFISGDTLVSTMTWNLPHVVKGGTLSFDGEAELYGIMLDGEAGVTVDNDPLRGSSGTIFTKIDEETMSASFSLINTRLILLQFGGNRVPFVYTPERMNTYLRRMKSQFDYFRRVAPRAKLCFIGPSDMGTSIDGKMQTWPTLTTLNDSLRALCSRNDVAYWDMFRVMGGSNSMVSWVKHTPPLAATDYIHFTQTGSEIIAHALSDALLTYYDFYRLRLNQSEDAIQRYMQTTENP